MIQLGSSLEWLIIIIYLLDIFHLDKRKNVQICFLIRLVEECKFLLIPRQAWLVLANCPHHDSSNKHVAGWLKYGSRTYQWFVDRPITIASTHVNSDFEPPNHLLWKEILSYAWQVSEYIFFSQNLSGFQESGHTFLENTAKK